MLEEGRDPGVWLLGRWERVLDELAGELAPELGPIAHQAEALVAKLAEAVSRAWPDPVLGYWVAAARRAGSSWADLAAILGVSPEDAAEKFGAWEERFAGQVGVPRGNLPVPLTSFIGRQAERSEVARLFSGCRMVTLCGAAGVGKTRLALKVGSTLMTAYPGGTWFVDLAPLDDEASVVRVVATSLGVREQPGRTLLQALCSRLGGQRVVLVLDNCEHLVAEAASLLNELLRACPGLSVLATSRQAIGVAGEVVWVVPTLSLPGEGQNLGRSDAAELFSLRASAVQAGFELTADMAPAVAEICRRLDGLPLAIELAASRVAVLSPVEIAARLDDRFGLLGDTVAGSHHHTLAEALDWSHEMLSAPEQVLFRRLSVFAGGFTLDAAESVCVGEAVRASEVLDLLRGLVVKSTVSAVTSGAEARYRMLETIRAYAGTRLVESGEVDTLRICHARWCLRLAERAEPELSGADERVWMDRLEVNYENLRAALSWFEAHGDVFSYMQLAGSLTLFWRVHSRFAEGRRWLEGALSAGSGTPSARAKVAWGAGFMASMLGDEEAAIAFLRDALALYRGEDDVQGCARCLMILADAEPLGAAPVALRYAEESVTLAREVGDNWCLTHALVESGRARVRMGDEAGGRAELEEAIAVARLSQSQQGLRLGLVVLGGVTLAGGDYERAEALLVEGIELERRFGDVYSQAMALTQLARLAIGRGEWELARRLLAEGVELASQSGNPQVIARAHCALGRLAQVENDLADANRHFAEVLSIAGAEGMARAWAIEGLGEVALASGDCGGANTHFDTVLAGPSNRSTKPLMARALHQLGELARGASRYGEAAPLHRRTLALRVDSGDRAGVPDSLEALAMLAVKSGRLHHGARLIGASDAIRQAGGFARWPSANAAHAAQVDALRTRLGPSRFEAARAAGATLSIDEAVDAAMGTRSPERSSVRVGGLTATELQVAALAAQGLTNPEIGQRLFMSRRTARAHLSAVFAKLGISSRQELATTLPVTDI